MQHPICLFTLEGFKHLHGLLGNTTLRTLVDGKLFEWSAVTRFCFTDPALRIAFATPGYETACTVQIERPARSRAERLELEGEGNIVSAGAPYRSRALLE